MSKVVQGIIVASIIAIGFNAPRTAANPPTSRSSSSPMTYQQAVAEYERQSRLADEAFEAELAKKGTDRDEVDQIHETRIVEASQHFREALDRLVEASYQDLQTSKDAERNLATLSQLKKIHQANTQLFESEMERRAKIVTLQLRRIGRSAATRPIEKEQGDLFKADPLTSYKRFCDQLIKGLNNPKLHDSSGRTTIGVAKDCQIDLRKTDSLVTPYTGVVVCKVTENSSSGTDSTDVKSTTYSIRFRVAGHDGRWIVAAIETQGKDGSWGQTCDFELAEIVAEAVRSHSSSQPSAPKAVHSAEQ